MFYATMQEVVRQGGAFEGWIRARRTEVVARCWILCLQREATPSTLQFTLRKPDLIASHGPTMHQARPAERALRPYDRRRCRGVVGGVGKLSLALGWLGCRTITTLAELWLAETACETLVMPHYI